MGYCSAATDIIRDKIPPKAIVVIRFFAHYVIPTIATVAYGGFRLKRTLKAKNSPTEGETGSDEDDTEDANTPKSQFIFAEFIQVIKQVVTRHEKTDDVIPTHEKRDEEEDEDRLFLMAILSEMKRVPEEYKLELKTDLMLAVRNWRRADKLPIQPNPLLGYEITNIHPTLHSQYFHRPNEGQLFLNKNVDKSSDAGMGTEEKADLIKDLVKN